MKRVLSGCCFAVLVTYASVYLVAIQEPKQAAQDSDAKASASGGRHDEVQLSEHLQTEDHLEAKLTPGQRKAVDSAKNLAPDNTAIFRGDGTLVQKGPSKDFENAFKACKDLRPISDKCWLCKDDGRIICKRAQKSTTDSSVPRLKGDPK